MSKKIQSMEIEDCEHTSYRFFVITLGEDGTESYRLKRKLFNCGGFPVEDVIAALLHSKIIIKTESSYYLDKEYEISSFMERVFSDFDAIYYLEQELGSNVWEYISCEFDVDLDLVHGIPLWHWHIFFSGVVENMIDSFREQIPSLMVGKDIQGIIMQDLFDTPMEKLLSSYEEK